MPIEPISFGVVIPVVMAMAAAANVQIAPDRISAYTIYGASVAAALVVLYQRSKNPQVDRWALFYSFVASWVAGWALPEWIVSWFTHDPQLLPKTWMLIAIGLGIGGSTIVNFAFKWWDTKGEQTLEKTISFRLPPGISMETGHNVEIIQDVKPKKPLSQGPAPDSDSDPPIS